MNVINAGTDKRQVLLGRLENLGRGHFRGISASSLSLLVFSLITNFLFHLFKDYFNKFATDCAKESQASRVEASA